MNRRDFLKASLALAGGIAVGGILAKVGIPALLASPEEPLFFPPGAGGAKRFLSKCTGCGLCLAACPEHLLIRAKGGIGPIRLDFSKGACRPDCHRCGSVCPTGAIQKTRTPIALAKLDASACRAFQAGEPCGKCAAACPVGAIQLRKSGAPKPVQAERCIGCGACLNQCPGYEGKTAIHMEPLP